ncbi:MAG TPA: hypothetical protein VLK85_22430 [Ramlibacter sp.]|nr:hypothetical protein [Ramlibacter sp.]
MKSTLRTRLAAALVLAPLGFIAAQPAAAQQFRPQAVVAQQPMIERFVLRTEGAIEPGEQVRFRVVGVPDARALLDVPGVLRARMTETRPGVYEVAYVVRWRDDPAAFTQAVVTLRRDGQQVSARVEDRGGWGDRYARDRRGPEISDLTPAQGDRVGEHRWTRISARVSDDRSGIAPDSVRLRVDGRDVSDRARLDGDEVRLRDDLAPGRHVAELLVRDRAGNTSSRAWSFDVVDRDRDRGQRYSQYGDDRRF